MKKRYYSIILFSLLSILFSSCASTLNDVELAGVSIYENESSIYHDFVTNYYSKVIIHNEPQRYYLNADTTEISYYGWGTSETSRPRPFHLKWKYLTNDNESYDYFRIDISTNNDMAYPISYISEDTICEINNLMLDTTYYYTVSAVYGDKEYTSNVNRFITEKSIIRPIYVSGVTNARDLGGYTNDENKKIKENMVFRMGELNTAYAEELTPKISEEGIKTLKEVFHIKSEIDLRMSDNNEVGHLTSSLLGEDVNYYLNTLGWDVNSAMFNESESIKKTMKIFADINNYPLLFHCAIGTDRTGLIACLLLSLLGVEEDIIIKDYLFSNFALIGGSRDLSAINTHLSNLKSFEGTSLKEKTANYLLSIGLTNTEIQSIRDIMLE